MKILVVGDCHGVKPDLPNREYDLVLAVGDICGGTEEMRQAMFGSKEGGEEWYSAMGEDKAREEVKRSLEDGREILDMLDGVDAPVYLVSGNWDWNQQMYPDWEFLQDQPFRSMVEEFGSVNLIDHQKAEISDYDIIGYGPVSAPEVPQYEDDSPEDEDELEEMRRDYRDTRKELRSLIGDKPVILLSHDVPHDTSLDRIDNEDSPAHGRHYGSMVVRDLLEEEKVFLNIAGHIHEGKGTEEIDGVRCMNTGLNQLAEIVVEDGEVREMEFI